MAIPQNTKIPSSSQFARLQDGRNTFRILSDIRVGWECWKDKKPVRHEGQVCKFKPEEADLNQSGRPNINYFWAMAVWNYKEGRVQVLQLAQKTVMSPLFDYEENPKWGDLKQYDIEINKKKEGDKTSYTVSANPKEELTEEITQAYQEANVDLGKLFEGGYPIEVEAEEITSEDIPF